MSETRMKQLGRDFEKIVQDAIELMAETESREQAELLMMTFESQVEEMPQDVYDMIWDGTADAKWSD